MHQPLAGEIAARRELLERMAFCTGYAVEMGMLLDVHATAGLDALAQVDLDVRQNRHQRVEDLSSMAAEVLAAVTSRLRREGRLLDDATAALLERPPLASLREKLS
jgi:glucosyl-3-phosphoglycerate synthase